MPARTPVVMFALCSVLVFTLSAAGGVYAQGRTVNPPIVRVELSGKEPLAAEAAQITLYGAAATLPAPAPTSSATRWALRPPNPDYPGPETLFRACGYTRPPLGTLTTPSGSRSVPASGGDSACWNYRIEWIYGMPLGTFTFTLAGPEGRLTHTWEMAYPSRPVTTHLKRDAGSGPALPLLLGFRPNESLRLHFYASPDNYAGYYGGGYRGYQAEYIATRNVQADRFGAVMLDVTLARSSPFVNQKIIYLIGGYDDPAALHFGSDQTAADFYYSRLVPVSIGGCPNSPPPRLQIGQNARVTPGDPNNIRAAPESGQVIGSIPAGGQFRVLEGPVCGPRRGLTWWKVSYQGIEGWTAEGQGGVYWLEPVR